MCRLISRKKRRVPRSGRYLHRPDGHRSCGWHGCGDVRAGVGLDVRCRYDQRDVQRHHQSWRSRIRDVQGHDHAADPDGPADVQECAGEHHRGSDECLGSGRYLHRPDGHRSCGWHGCGDVRAGVGLDVRCRYDQSDVQRDHQSWRTGSATFKVTITPQVVAGPPVFTNVPAESRKKRRVPRERSLPTPTRRPQIPRVARMW